VLRIGVICDKGETYNNEREGIIKIPKSNDLEAIVTSLVKLGQDIV
jgi:hypothetical protein